MSYVKFVSFLSREFNDREKLVPDKFHSLRDWPADPTLCNELVYVVAHLNCDVAMLTFYEPLVQWLRECAARGVSLSRHCWTTESIAFRGALFEAGADGNFIPP